jgi:hypothetical protein
MQPRIAHGVPFNQQIVLSQLAEPV